MSSDPLLANLTERARKAVQLAAQEAHRLNHARLSTEHLLLGLVKEGQGIAGRFLTRNLFTLAWARAEVEAIAPAVPSRVVTVPLARAADVEAVLTQAAMLAVELGHQQVGTGHLLMALLMLPTTTEAMILTHMFPQPERVRETLVEALQETNWLEIEACRSLEGAQGSPPELVWRSPFE